MRDQDRAVPERPLTEHAEELKVLPAARRSRRI
jgi:hypothetical protein